VRAEQLELAEVWLRRDETQESLAKVRREFTQTNVRRAIQTFDIKIAERYQYLYHEAISWGAHPNEKALTSSLRILDDAVNRERTIQVIMLPHGGKLHQLALQRCAQIGLCVLEIFALISPERFALLGINEMLKDARVGL
jgi:hypothetical protein